MKKIDTKIIRPDLTLTAAKGVVLVDLPPMNFLMIDGTGDPNTAPAYQEAMAALYAMAYTIKFKLKKGKKAIDYRVMPLEGQPAFRDIVPPFLADPGRPRPTRPTS